jgi:hypothetical protein
MCLWPRFFNIDWTPYSSEEFLVKEGAKKDEQEADARRPRMASKSVKLQRPDSGHRVQSLLKRTWPPASCQLQYRIGQSISRIGRSVYRDGRDRLSVRERGAAPPVAPVCPPTWLLQIVHIGR